MTTDPGTTTRNWFSQGGEAYARFRPEYPGALAEALADLAPDRRLAVDVGCGTGQLTAQLAEHFERTIGLDPSEDQLRHATPHPRAQYRPSPAETLDVPSGSASLITAAQAAHWFDLPRFYGEVRRVAAPGAVLSLLSYGTPTLDDTVNARFQHFYNSEVGRYWPPERQLVDSGYATLDFPFKEQPGPALDIHKAWPLADLLGYVSTWSAVRRAREAGQDALLHRFAEDLAELWGDPATERSIRWPVNMRLGVV